MKRYRIVILGANYGLLPAVRMVLAGHDVTVVCREDERRALSANGAAVSFLRRDRTLDQRVAIAASGEPSTGGSLRPAGPQVGVDDFDIAFFAMAEPQYAVPEIAELLGRIARTRLPIVFLMNSQPPPFLRRLGTLDVDRMKSAYAAWDQWSLLDPDLVTAASPDAQAIRNDPAKTNEISVTLDSNFKIAPFARSQDQATLHDITESVTAYRRDGAALPVRLISHQQIHVPLAKWPMLITGNCRCLMEDGSIIPIRDAVLGDEARSEAIFERVLDIVRAAGAPDEALVPFRFYARAARRLTRPSSFARAASTRGTAVERVDKMVQLAGRGFGMTIPELDGIVTRTDALVGIS